MAGHLMLSLIPTRCQSPTVRPPKHRALVMGINCGGLKGPVNDAKEMKKALIELYHYKEGDICLMTDEETNENTPLWPSRANIVGALHDLVCDARPGDVFVFFCAYLAAVFVFSVPPLTVCSVLDAGHCGQQPATIDRNEIDGLDEYIVTCDGDIILDDTLREYLVNPLPAGARLTAILDACHSGTLLDLNHYSGHRFLPQRVQSLPVKKPAKYYERLLPRHHSDDDMQCWLVRGATQLFHMSFSFIATITLVIVRFKVRSAKRKQAKFGVGVVVGAVDCVDRAVTLSPISIPSPPCGGWGSCTGACSNCPLVISVSSCSDEQSTWEDSQNKGKSMTTKLVKILRENPSINVGDLKQLLQGSLTKAAYKRLWAAKSAFKTYSAKLSPEKRNMYEGIYIKQGLFELREQTAQFGSLHPLRQEEEFIVRADTLYLGFNALFDPS